MKLSILFASALPLLAAFATAVPTTSDASDMNMLGKRDGCGARKQNQRKLNSPCEYPGPAELCDCDGRFVVSLPSGRLFVRTEANVSLLQLKCIAASGVKGNGIWEPQAECSNSGQKCKNINGKAEAHCA